VDIGVDRLFTGDGMLLQFAYKSSKGTFFKKNPQNYTSSDPKKKLHFSLKINSIMIKQLNQTKLSDKTKAIQML